MNQSTFVYEESFPSIYGRETALVDGVLNQLKDKQWSDKDIFAVNLALVEAIANAIEHGNECNPGKNVYIQCRITNKSISIKIRDEGIGFRKELIPDPRNEHQLDQPTGRGLLLIYSFMTKVSYNDSGNELSMTKHRTKCA